MRDEDYYKNIKEALKSMIRRQKALNEKKLLESYSKTLKEFEQDELNECNYVEHDPVSYLMGLKL